ncbi:Isoleucyl-tRNA synthetase, partial [hydrothermal vent metagenome]
NDELAQHWARIRNVRKVVLGALEVERREKRLGSSLDSTPVVWLQNAKDMEAIQQMADGSADDFFADVCITSALTLRTSAPDDSGFTLDDVPGVVVDPRPATGVKCARSWKFFDPATADAAYPDISPRDAIAVRQWDASNG